MERVATRRLIDAAASLDAADRALLNLWVNRGLDDAAVGRMTGMEPEAIAERRGRVVTRLSDELGLPPEQIAQTLAALSVADGQPVQGAAETGPPEAEPDGAAAAEPVDTSGNGHAPMPQSVVATAEVLVPETADTIPTPVAHATPILVPAGSDTGGPRRRLWAWIPMLLAVAMVVAVVVIVLGGSSSEHRRSVTTAHTQPAPAPAVPTQSVPTQTIPTTAAAQTSPSPPATASRPQNHSLAPLPGGVSRATGLLVLTGKRKHLKLRLTVSHLPAARGGHYEVWLYNTVIESQPLARLRNGVRHLVIRLPRRSARFHWIDISFQPAGLVYHSGESILRATNPARTSPRKLRRRSARKRQLRRATSGSKRASKSK